MNHMVKELWFSGDNQRIYGELSVPEKIQNHKKFPIVILCHGFSGTHQKVSGYTQRLLEEGIAVLSFDFCGGGKGCRSDGSSVNMSVMTNLRDLEAVMRKIREMDFCDPENLFLMGESQGGLVCALAAGKHAEAVNSLILFYPAFNIPDVCQKSFPDPQKVPETYETLGMKIGRPYYNDAVHLDVWNAVRNYDHPVLIMHGTEDHIVPYAWSEKALKVYPRAQLIPVKGSDHGFHGTDETYAVHTAAEFIKKNLKK